MGVNSLPSMWSGAMACPRWPPEHAAGGHARIYGKVCAELGLHEGVGGEELIEGGEGLELRGARAESACAIAGGEEDAALHAEDGAGRRLEKRSRLRPRVMSPTLPSRPGFGWCS